MTSRKLPSRKLHSSPGDYRRNMPGEYRAIAIALLRERDGDLCVICGEKVFTEAEMGLDHIIPVAQGGLHDVDNVGLCHRTCNTTKSRLDRTPNAYCVRGHARIKKNLRLAYVGKHGPIYGCKVCHNMLRAEWREKRRQAGLKVV